MTVTYTVFGGEIVSENRGGVERDYIPDTNGNTIALIDENQNITDTWEYWPFGEVRSRTGSNPTPFSYVGTLGYYKDSASELTYVRARYLQSGFGQWMTMDPVWPYEPPYTYAGNNPVSNVDPSGQWCLEITGCSKTQKENIKDAFRSWLGGIEAMGDCTFGLCLPASVTSCLTKLRDCTVPPGIPKIVITCKKCKDKKLCGFTNRLTGEMTLCIPSPKRCKKKLQCVLAHELLHVCKVLGEPSNSEAFECVSKHIKGCKGFARGH